MTILARVITGAFYVSVLLLALIFGFNFQTLSNVSSEPLANGEIVLVARDLVDLNWNYRNYPPAGTQFVRWELYRGLSPDSLAKIASGQDMSVDHYRDTGLALSTTFHYRLDFVRCSATCQPHETITESRFTDSATSGVFQGEVHHDLTLGSAIYGIGFGDVSSSASVKVVEGATLKIGSGTTVQTATTVSSGSLSVVGGRIEIDGATLKNVAITYGDYDDLTSTGAGWVRGSTMEAGNVNVAIVGYGNSDFNVENNTGIFDIVADQQSKLRAIKNTMAGGIDVKNQAAATISGNHITDDEITVSGYGATATPKAYAHISDNQITSAVKHLGIEISYGATANVLDNEISYTDFHGSESSILISVSDADSVLTAERNLINNGKIGVFWGPSINLVDNVIKGGGSAITVGCVVCGSSIQGTGTIKRNTLQGGWGFEMWAGSHALTISHNCIRGNDPGLTTDDQFITNPVNVQYNWWGDPSGPSHENNPGGFGDVIVGDKSIFDPWDTADTYCRDLPPPPGKPDLKVEGVKMVQVVEGVDILVEAKPLAVKAVVSSSEPLVDPVIVILHYGGKSYEEFFLVEAANIGKDFLLKYSSSQLLFPKPGNKTIYFFPELAPFGTVATASVEVDPENSYDESNELNNIDSTTQLVVKTYWGTDPGDQAFRAHYTFQMDLFLKNVDSLRKATRFIQDMVSVLPIAPIDYHANLGIDKDLDTECRPAGETLAELAKRKHRALKSAHPDYLRFTVYPPQFWFSKSVCSRTELPSSGRYSYWLPKGSPEMIFLSTAIFGKLPRPMAVSYGVATDDNFGAVYGGVNVELHLLPDENIAIEIYNGHVRSFMGESTKGNGLWYDDTDYLVFLTGRTAHDSPPDRALARSLTTGELLLVSGTVADNGTASLDPIFRLPAGAANIPSKGPYTIKFLDDGDGVLFSHAFDLDFTDETEAGPLVVEEASFSFGLPYYAGIARVVVEKDSVPLDSVIVTNNTPAVTVSNPDGGENLSGITTINWTANDDDGDDLAYAVLYSNNDGLTWTTLAMDLLVNTFSWDTEEYSGADGTGRIKVMASDGFHTAEDISDAAFSVGNKAPSAGIVSPFDGAVFPLGVPAVLEGAGYDLEQGWLDGAALTWESTTGIAIGTGSIVSPTLTLGQHVIRLTAEDEHGLNGTTNITITVSNESRPDLSIVPDSLTHYPSPAVAHPGWLAVDVRNIVADVEANLTFYQGDPSHGGILIGQTLILAEANTVTTAGIDWLPLSPGTYTVYAVITNANPAESDTANNQAMAVIEVANSQNTIHLPLIRR